MIRYPHTLTFTWFASATIGSNGRPTSEGATVTVTIPCRYEVNGSGKFINSESGVNLIYSFKVLSNRLPQLIPAGSVVEIEGKKYTVIRHNNLQISSTVWV